MREACFVLRVLYVGWITKKRMVQVRWTLAQRFLWIGFLNHLFYERRYIASAPSLSSTAELSKSCALLGSWMAGSGATRRSQVRAGQEIAPVGRTQSERRRRLALAGGFRLLKPFRIDRLDAPVRPALERPRLRSRGRALVERVSPHVDVHVSSLGRLYVYLQSLGRLDFTYHMFSPSKKPSRSRDLIASPALFTGKTAEE